MGRQVCGAGHEWKTRFQAHPSELRCPEDGCGLPAEPTLKAKGGGLGPPESRVLAEGHGRFRQLVTEWPCFFRENRNGHTCWGEFDPHHLIPASWIKSTFRGIPDPELADILYAPLIGVPLFIYWHELDPELKDFCKRIDAKYGRQSMFERLKLESPQKSPENPEAAAPKGAVR